MGACGSSIPVPFPGRRLSQGCPPACQCRLRTCLGCTQVDPLEATGRAGAASCHLNSREKGGQTFRGWNLNRRRRNLSRGLLGRLRLGLQDGQAVSGTSSEEHLELLTHFHSRKGIQPPKQKPKEAWPPSEVQTALNQDFHPQPLGQLLRRRGSGPSLW